MAELKPCPFCGEEAALETFSTVMENRPRYRVRCSGCGVATDWSYYTSANAEEAWNRRA